MKVLIISKEWFPIDKTGLGISTYNHEQIFRENGFNVKTLSNNHKYNTDYIIKLSGIFHFLFKFLKLRNKAKKVILDFKPDLIVLESLQTCLSELFLSLNLNNNYKIILISHGISILPYKYSLKYILRSILYLPYLPLLFLLSKKIDILYSLKHSNNSDRHLDEIFFKIVKKNPEIIKYFNTSRFEKNNSITKKNNVKILSHFGYLGDIKNQLDFLKIAEIFKEEKIIFRIIYQNYNKNYLQKCKNLCKKKKLNNVQFVDGNKADIEKYIKESFLILNTSVTEVFPLILVEAINLGIPFVSFDKGSISFIKGGLIAKNINEMTNYVNLLVKNEFFYKGFKKQAKKFYFQNLNNFLLKEKFKNINFK